MNCCNLCVSCTANARTFMVHACVTAVSVHDCSLYMRCCNLHVEFLHIYASHVFSKWVIAASALAMQPLCELFHPLRGTLQTLCFVLAMQTLYGIQVVTTTACNIVASVWAITASIQTVETYVCTLKPLNGLFQTIYYLHSRYVSYLSLYVGLKNSNHKPN